MIFLYEAKGIGRDGTITAVRVMASGRSEAASKVRELGLHPLSVSFSRENLRTLPGKSQVSDREIVDFNREVQVLLKAGIPLLKAIQRISGRIRNPFFRVVVEEIGRSVERGQSLSESVLPFSSLFGELYSPILRSGESSGNLPEVIADYNRYHLKVLAIKDRVKKALIYPAFVASFSFVVFFVLLVWVIPRFALFYKDFDAQLPWLTRVVVGLGEGLSRNLFPIALFVVALFFFLPRLMRKEQVRRVWDKFYLSLPFGGLLKDFTSVLYGRGFSLMLTGGIPIVKALQISLSSVKNIFLAEKMAPVHERVMEGKPLADSWEETGLFPADFLDVVRVGEHSGSLGEMVKEATVNLEERLEGRVDSLLSFLEPAIIIVMGLMIALVLLSVYMPITSIVQVIR